MILSGLEFFPPIECSIVFVLFFFLHFELSRNRYQLGNCFKIAAAHLNVSFITVVEL